ncbi:MAG: hypothetical protein V3V65_05580, partial [Hyphomicrobium sp.]
MPNGGWVHGEADSQAVGGLEVDRFDRAKAAHAARAASIPSSAAIGHSLGQPSWYENYVKARTEGYGQRAIDEARGAYDRRLAGEGSVAQAAQTQGLGGAYDRAVRVAAANPLAAQQGSFATGRAGSGIIGKASAGREREMAQARAMVSDSYNQHMARTLQAQRLKAARQAMLEERRLNEYRRQQGIEQRYDAAQKAYLLGVVNAAGTVAGASSNFEASNKGQYDFGSYYDRLDKATAGLTYADQEQVAFADGPRG